MSIEKLLASSVLALSLVACANTPLEPGERVLAVCGEAEITTGSIIAKRDKCVDKSPEALAASREKLEAMREEQNRLQHNARMDAMK